MARTGCWCCNAKLKHKASIRFIILAFVVGVPIGIGAFTFYYGKGYSYLTNDPAACANCHVMGSPYESWGKSSHRAVAACNDCHTPSTLGAKYLTKLIKGLWESANHASLGQTMWAGYAFSRDFREERGHAFMLIDQIYTERQKAVQQPGTCINCHASTYVPMMKLGQGDLIKGFEILNKMPYQEARTHVKHPVACIDLSTVTTLTPWNFA